MIYVSIKTKTHRQLLAPLLRLVHIRALAPAKLLVTAEPLAKHLCIVCLIIFIMLTTTIIIIIVSSDPSLHPATIQLAYGTQKVVFFLLFIFSILIFICLPVGLLLLRNDCDTALPLHRNRELLFVKLHFQNTTRILPAILVEQPLPLTHGVKHHEPRICELPELGILPHEVGPQLVHVETAEICELAQDVRLPPVGPEVAVASQLAFRICV